MMTYRLGQQLIEVIEMLVQRIADAKLDEIHNIGSKLYHTVAIEHQREEDLCVPERFSYLQKLRDIGAKIKETKDSKDILTYLHEQKQELKENQKPLKMAFFTQENSLWPSFQTVWEACEPHVTKDLVLVYYFGRPAQEEDYELLMKPYIDADYPIRWMADYNPKEEMPDIVFFMKPYKGFRACPKDFYVKDINEITPYTVFISYCLDVQGSELLQDYFYGQPFFYYVWKIIGYSNYYQKKMIERGYRNGENVALLGHPKFDVSYMLSKSKKYIHGDWEQKIHGRKVVMWNTHFSVEPGKGVGTYFIWKDTIFDYFEKHRDLVLLWRPHPLFWESIIKSDQIDPQELDEFVYKLEQRNNIIIDRTGDYRYSFCMSNALISDAATFLVEYSASGKPVLYTVKEDGEKVCNDDYLVGMQIAQTTEDITRYLDEVRSGEADRDADKRLLQFKKIFGEIDGQIGKRIYDYVLSEMHQDIHRRAQEQLRVVDEEDSCDVE